MAIASAVFSVTHQRKATAGKLHTDLVAATGVKADVNQAGFSGRETMKLQSGLFDTDALPFDDKNLVFLAILPK